MSGWSILLKSMVCLSGALVFLRLVVSALQSADTNLKAYEQRKVKMHKERLEAGLCPAEGDTPVLEPATKTA
ncbi:MAG: hypothetical protein JSU63_16415 [Phycisphaerales bacterium]|nr:MAG: hypothetical protein JSU63_16415 [Phycisphaerales bacterium]